VQSLTDSAFESAGVSLGASGGDHFMATQGASFPGATLESASSQKPHSSALRHRQCTKHVDYREKGGLDPYSELAMKFYGPRALE